MAPFTHPPLPRATRRPLLPARGGVLLGPRPGRGRQGKSERKRQRTSGVTRTFTNPSLIFSRGSGPAAPYPSPLRIFGFKRGKLLDINVTLQGFSHDAPAGVDVLLRSPTGRRAIVMSDARTLSADDVTLTLDDQATALLTNTTRLTSGRFRPANDQQLQPATDPTGGDANFADAGAGGSGTTANVRLATGKGINPNGVWSRFINDDTVSDTGEPTFGWSLRIRTKVRR